MQIEAWNAVGEKRLKQQTWQDTSSTAQGDVTERGHCGVQGERRRRGSPFKSAPIHRSWANAPLQVKEAWLECLDTVWVLARFKVFFRQNQLEAEI